MKAHRIFAKGDYVYRDLENNRVEKVAIKRLHTSPTQIAIEAPLTEGDQLVTDGSDRLKPGSLVKAAKSDKPNRTQESEPTNSSKE
jgi:hypothetical protein